MHSNNRREVTALKKIILAALITFLMSGQTFAEPYDDEDYDDDYYEDYYEDDFDEDDYDDDDYYDDEDDYYDD